ncbi:MAG: sulfotransferase [Candidatus Woesearchaeota archaeon]
MENKLRKYIIIGCSRSGTTVTHIALKGHPHVYALNDEVKIKNLFHNPLSLFTHGNNLKEEEEKFIRVLFEDITSLNPAQKKINAKGIKVAVAKPEEAKLFVSRIKTFFPDVYIIFVKRNELLAQYASAVRAQKSGKHHSWQKAKKNVPKIKINKYKYVSYLLDCLQIHSEIEQLNLTNHFIEFNYENDIMQNNYGKLFEFMKLDNIPPDWIDANKLSPSPQTFIKDYGRLQELTKNIIVKYNNNDNLTKEMRIKSIIDKYKMLRHKFSRFVK